MKPRAPKLHVRILLGLALGAVFGAAFHVDSRTVLVTKAGAEGGTVAIRGWRSFALANGRERRAFGAGDQLAILTAFRRMAAASDSVAVAAVAGRDTIRVARAASVGKEETVATAIRPVGDLFIRLLMMIAVPLVFASLLVGVVSLRSAGRLARIGGKTVGYYLVTTALAISLGLAIGDAVRPGHRMDAESRDRLLAVYDRSDAPAAGREVSIDVLDFLVSIVPKNPVAAMANAEMLPIIFFATMFGFAVLFLPREKADRVTGFFDAVSDAMIRLVDIVMRIAPFAVFALVSAVVGEFGFGILGTLAWYMATVVAGLAVQTFVVYPLFLKAFARRISVRRFFRELRPVHLVAFTTSSSAATLPVNYECCERLGAPPSVTSFVLPLGATINMDGTALYQGVATLFIAQVFGMDLTLWQQATVVLTATLASIGTAPVPGVGIVMLLVVLRSVGVPEEGIALILGVDRLLDMCRTIPNVTGDATAAMIVASTEGTLGPGIPANTAV
jgi:proton glutamate symport protein